MAEDNPLGWRRMLGPFGPRPRLTVSIVVGVAVGLALMVLAPQMVPSTRLILGWDALSLTFLGAMLVSMAEHSPTDIRARAAVDDQGRGVILTLVLLAAAVSVWAVARELSLAKDGHGVMKAARIALAFLTVVVSWLMVQVVFALHYAHEYYGLDESDGVGDTEGLKFPGPALPNYWDFLHFSIIIGATCQTADIEITSQGLRRLGTVHSLVAFAFNTIIVALTINLTAGLF